ncbi:MAG: DNA-directed RNA polymerase subunit beta, partial [Planctomycetaceae bacterium]|nr:DNA-directed RNA polymerase subunit beta [Planctomycetaceae bacterium]
MPIPATRIIAPETKKNFGEKRAEMELTDLTRIQTDSYANFLQLDRPARERKNQGLEEILREVFPIESYDEQYRLEYIKYELGKPRYDATECRQLRLTYGRPFRVWLRLVKEQPVEEEVYLGDMPIMIGGGEFIINGAERVVVSQLHRSPGVDFVRTDEPGEKKNFSCRIIPERGSWIELVVSKRDALGVRIDQSGKFSAMTLLRAMEPEYSSDAALVKLFYRIKEASIKASGANEELVKQVAAEDVIYPIGHDRCGEIIVECGQTITAELAMELGESGIKKVELIENPEDQLVLNSIEEDGTASHEEALLKIYQRLRPGNPPALDKAIDLFQEKFFDVNRYRLGRVGRFRINRKFNQDIPDTEMTLRAEDFVNAIRYLIKLRISDDSAHVDDIDNLGNRRLRTIDEL